MKNYTVEFYKLKICGGVFESDGTTIVDEYKECLCTENKYEAFEEFNDRKELITVDNLLGVSLVVYEGSSELRSIEFSSEDLIDENSIDNILKYIEF